MSLSQDTHTQQQSGAQKYQLSELQKKEHQIDIIQLLDNEKYLKYSSKTSENTNSNINSNEQHFYSQYFDFLKNVNFQQILNKTDLHHQTQPFPSVHGMRQICESLQFRNQLLYCLKKKLIDKHYFLCKYPASQSFSTQKIYIQITKKTQHLDVFQINCNLGPIAKQYTVLLQDYDSFRHNYMVKGIGTHGKIYTSSKQSKTAFKCLHFPLKSSAFRDCLRQFFIADLLSNLQIGPKITKSCGFDLIIFRNCIQFQMQICQRPKADKMVQELTKDLGIMHLLNIVHSDIKPTNIMYSLSFCKNVFIDFGTAQMLNEPLGAETMTRFKGTYEYCGQAMKRIINKKQNVKIDLYINDVQMLSKVLNQLKQVKEVPLSMKYYRSDQGIDNLLDQKRQEVNRQQLLLKLKYEIYFNKQFKIFDTEFRHFIDSLLYQTDKQTQQWLVNRSVQFAQNIDQQCLTLLINQFVSKINSKTQYLTMQKNKFQISQLTLENNDKGNQPKGKINEESSQILKIENKIKNNIKLQFCQKIFMIMRKAQYFKDVEPKICINSQKDAFNISKVEQIRQILAQSVNQQYDHLPQQQPEPLLQAWESFKQQIFDKKYSHIYLSLRDHMTKNLISTSSGQSEITYYSKIVLFFHDQMFSSNIQQTRRISERNKKIMAGIRLSIERGFQTFDRKDKLADDPHDQMDFFLPKYCPEICFANQNYTDSVWIMSHLLSYCYFGECNQFILQLSMKCLQLAVRIGFKVYHFYGKYLKKYFKRQIQTKVEGMLALYIRQMGLARYYFEKHLTITSDSLDQIKENYSLITNCYKKIDYSSLYDTVLANNGGKQATLTRSEIEELKACQKLWILTEIPYFKQRDRYRVLIQQSFLGQILEKLQKDLFQNYGTPEQGHFNDMLKYLQSQCRRLFEEYYVGEKIQYRIALNAKPNKLLQSIQRRYLSEIPENPQFKYVGRCSKQTQKISLYRFPQIDQKDLMQTNLTEPALYHYMYQRLQSAVKKQNIEGIIQILYLINRESIGTMFANYRTIVCRLTVYLDLLPKVANSRQRLEFQILNFYKKLIQLATIYEEKNETQSLLVCLYHIFQIVATSFSAVYHPVFNTVNFQQTILLTIHAHMLKPIQKYLQIQLINLLIYFKKYLYFKRIDFFDFDLSQLKNNSTFKFQEHLLSYKTVFQLFGEIIKRDNQLISLGNVNVYQYYTFRLVKYKILEANVKDFFYLHLDNKHALSKKSSNCTQYNKIVMAPRYWSILKAKIIIDCKQKYLVETFTTLVLNYLLRQDYLTMFEIIFYKARQICSSEKTQELRYFSDFFFQIDQFPINRFKFGYYFYEFLLEIDAFKIQQVYCLQILIHALSVKEFFLQNPNLWKKVLLLLIKLHQRSEICRVFSSNHRQQKLYAILVEYCKVNRKQKKYKILLKKLLNIFNIKPGYYNIQIQDYFKIYLFSQGEYKKSKKSQQRIFSSLIYRKKLKFVQNSLDVNFTNIDIKRTSFKFLNSKKNKINSEQLRIKMHLWDKFGIVEYFPFLQSGLIQKCKNLEKLNQEIDGSKKIKTQIQTPRELNLKIRQDLQGQIQNIVLKVKQSPQYLICEQIVSILEEYYMNQSHIVIQMLQSKGIIAHDREKQNNDTLQSCDSSHYVGQKGACNDKAGNKLSEQEMKNKLSKVKILEDKAIYSKFIQVVKIDSYGTNPS